jgi:hypothetical protein
MRDAEAVAAVLLVGKGLCLGCIADKSGLDRERVIDALPKLMTIIRVVETDGQQCSRCSERGTVYCFASSS